jgi:hypothetical protein
MTGQKIPAAKKRWKPSLELRERWSKIKIGKKLPESVRKKMSESQKGRIVSAETRKKISSANRGRKRSMETRLLMSLSRKGVPKSRPRSHSHRLKLSAAARQNFEKGILSIGKRGIDNHGWINDRTKLRKFGDCNRDRRTYAAREWRCRVWNRDGFRCRIRNNDCNGRLEAHHILSWKLYPELRYDLNNGITLCHYHHPRTRASEDSLREQFQDMISQSLN